MTDSRRARLRKRLKTWFSGKLKNYLKMLVFWKSVGYISRKLKKKLFGKRR